MNWTDAKNNRRCDLIDKEIDGTLASGEQDELDGLQGEMLRWRNKLAPRPIEEVRKLHSELKARAK